jgi:hypothetical protein
MRFKALLPVRKHIMERHASLCDFSGLHVGRCPQNPGRDARRSMMWITMHQRLIDHHWTLVLDVPDSKTLKYYPYEKNPYIRTIHLNDWFAEGSNRKDPMIHKLLVRTMTLRLRLFASS